MTTAAAYVPDDLPCDGCGYLLHGLDADGRCPECGRAIAESIAAHAAMPRSARRAIQFAAVAVTVAVALQPFASSVAYADWFPTRSSFYLNRDGVRHLLAAALFLPAAWWVTRAHKSLRPKGRRVRGVVLSLPVLLAILAGQMLAFALVRYRPAIVGLLFTYGLAPVFEAVETILLLGMLISVTRAIPNPPAAKWLRAAWAVQCLYGGKMLIEALSSATVQFARVLLQFDAFEPAKDSYLPAGVGKVLQWIWDVTYRINLPLYCLAVITLIAFTVALIRRPRFAPR